MAPPEDWLPHEPPPTVPAKNSVGQTFVIWLLLVMMFVAIYALMSGNEVDAELEPTGYAGWWIVVAVAITIAVTIVFLVWLVGNTKRFNEQATPGLEAIADGKYAHAAALFEVLARRYRAKPNFAAVASYNRGYALLRAGHTEAAVGILLGVERTPKLAAGGVRRMAATQLARCFAFAGDIEKAQRWLASARRRPPGMADPVHDQANIDALEALVLCRQGKLDEARTLYEACWSRLDTYLPVSQMVEVWLLRAYAIAAGSTPRDAGAAEPWLRLLRGAPPATLDMMTARWPALATFVVTNGLAARDAA